MSDNIPFELQVEIMKRLPVKSLLQFRSVSKTWKSLIDSSCFIKHYTGQDQHLIVRYEGTGYFDEHYASFVDDDSFPNQRVSLNVPTLVKMFNVRSMIDTGSSHGLLCLYGRRPCFNDPIFGRFMAVIWNLSVRRAVGVVVPNVADNEIYTTVLGFGVCKETTDPKIVKITQIVDSRDIESISSIPSQVEVFTLSTRTWRHPYSTKLPRKSIHFDHDQVIIDGTLYWLAVDMIQSSYLIITFDMTTEEFRELNLPHSLAQSTDTLILSRMRESLVVLDDETKVVWMMDGVSKSFTKLFNIGVNMPHSLLLGFRKSGEPILEILENRYRLVVYEPYSGHMDDFGINGIDATHCVYPYIETLLLLDHPNRMIYDEKETLQLPSSYVS